MYLEHEETAKMVAGSYEWDLLIITPSGVAINGLYGIAIVKTTVTSKNPVKPNVHGNDFLLF